MVIFQYNLYIFGIHLRTMLYPKLCYNELCYKEVEVYFEYIQRFTLFNKIMTLTYFSWYKTSYHSNTAVYCYDPEVYFTVE